MSYLVLVEIFLVSLLVPTVVTTTPSVPFDSNSDDSMRTISLDLRSAKSCQFEPVNDELSEILGKKLAINGIKLLRYNITFVNYTYDVMLAPGGDLFRPNLWIRTVNREGTNLLMFDDNFEVFSIGLLGVGIEDMSVQLTDHPRGCIHNLTASERLKQMRRLLQVDFKINSTDIVDEVDEQICNMRMYIPSPEVKSEHPGARFTFTCCHSDDHHMMQCADIDENSWVTTLIQILKTIIVFLVLYSPIFVPRVYYAGGTKTTNFEIQIPEKAVVNIEKENGEYFIPKPDELINLDRMASAKTRLDNFGEGVSDCTKFRCQVHEITISVPRDRLLEEDSAPVSIPTMIYENLFHCEIGRLSSFTACCLTSFYGEIFGERIEKYKMKWNECLKIFVKILLFCVCLVPSIVQYVIYDGNIAPGVAQKQESLKRINATFAHQGNFEFLGLGNQSLHFYSIVIVVMSGIALEVYHHFIKRFCAIPEFKTHFQDMEKQKFLPILKSILQLSLVPFLKCGVLGIFVFPFFLIVILAYTAHFLIIMFPLLNLIFRLLLYPFLPSLVARRRQFLEYFGITGISGNTENICERVHVNKFWAAWYPYVAIFVIFITYLLLWIVDCVIFYTKILFYTCIGIIANSDKTLPYFTVVFLVGIYIGQIFGNLSNIYREYSKIIRNLILSRSSTDYDTMVRKTNDGLTSMAFPIQESPGVKDVASSLTSHGTDGPVYVNSKQLLIFVERTEEKQPLVPCRDSFYESFDAKVQVNHRVLTPEKVFLDVIELDVHGSPGAVWKNLLWACVRLVIVLAFLIFVVIVVMGLGDTYKISITNQLFLAVAGGLLPLIFRHVVSENVSIVTVDGDSSDLKLNIVQRLRNYNEDWEVADINLSLLEIMEGQGHSKERDQTKVNVVVSVDDTDSVNIARTEHNIN